MLRPPSTARIWPVTYGASAAKKNAARAMSSGEPVRLSAVLRDDFVLQVLVEAALGPEDRPGRDGVDAHLRPEFARQRAGQHDQPGLGRGVHRVALERSQAVDVDHVQDQAARCGAAPGRPPATGTAARAGWCRPGRRTVRGVIEPTGVAIEARCVVDQHVEPAETRDRGRDQRRQGGRRRAGRRRTRQPSRARAVQFRHQRAGLVRRRIDSARRGRRRRRAAGGRSRRRGGGRRR